MRIPKGGVAFFDSGIGGLTVLSECRKRIPNEIFYYYGDNAHAPYGNFPPQKIKRYVFRVFKKFFRLKVRAVVIACNTVTAVCIEELRRKYAFPIIGAEPAVTLAAKRGGTVLVLTTRATFESERFKRLCERTQERFTVSEILPVPCETLAGAIEEHMMDSSYDFASLLPPYAPASVVLGCTHYIYIKEKIRAFYGCPTYDGNEGIANRLKKLLGGDDEYARFGLTHNNKKPLKKKQGKKIGENRPLDATFSKKMPFIRFFRKIYAFITSIKMKKTNKITNKCSDTKNKKCSKFTKKESFPAIFFLGSQKKINETLYEQMFVRDFEPKNSRLG